MIIYKNLHHKYTYIYTMFYRYSFCGGAYSLRRTLANDSRYKKMTRADILTKIEKLNKFKSQEYSLESGLKTKADKGYLAHVYSQLKRHVRQRQGINQNNNQNNAGQAGAMTSTMPTIQPVIQSVGSITQTATDYPRNEPDEDPDEDPEMIELNRIVDERLYIARLTKDPIKRDLMVEAVQKVAKKYNVSLLIYENMMNFLNPVSITNFINKYNLPFTEIKNMIDGDESEEIKNMIDEDESEEIKEKKRKIDEENLYKDTQKEFIEIFKLKYNQLGDIIKQSIVDVYNNKSGVPKINKKYFDKENIKNRVSFAAEFVAKNKLNIGDIISKFTEYNTLSQQTKYPLEETKNKGIKARVADDENTDEGKDDELYNIFKSNYNQLSKYIKEAVILENNKNENKVPLTYFDRPNIGDPLKFISSFVSAKKLNIDNIINTVNKNSNIIIEKKNIDIPKQESEIKESEIKERRVRRTTQGPKPKKEKKERKERKARPSRKSPIEKKEPEIKEPEIKEPEIKEPEIKIQKSPKEEIKPDMSIHMSDLPTTALQYLRFWINGQEHYISSTNVDKYKKYNIKDMILRMERNLLKVESDKEKLKKEIKKIMVSTSDNKKQSLYNHINDMNNIFIDELIYSSNQYRQDLYKNDFHIILQYMKIFDPADMYADLPFKTKPQSIINTYDTIKTTYTSVYEILNS